MNLLNDNIAKLKQLCKSYNVESLYVFGSVLNETFNTESDIDFLVKFNQIEHSKYYKNYLDFKDKLKQVFNRDIDLIEEQTLKNPILIQSINKNKALIYG